MSNKNSGFRRVIRALRKEAERKDGFLVQLEDGVWLADGEGDPPRTLLRDNSKYFHTQMAAYAALAKARKYRPFMSAVVTSSELAGG